MTLPETEKMDDWTSLLLAVHGIEEVVVMPEKQVAYIKVDKQQITDTARQELSRLLNQELAI